VAKFRAGSDYSIAVISWSASSLPELISRILLLFGPIDTWSLFTVGSSLRSHGVLTILGRTHTQFVLCSPSVAHRTLPCELLSRSKFLLFSFYGLLPTHSVPGLLILIPFSPFLLHIADYLLNCFLGSVYLLSDRMAGFQRHPFVPLPSGSVHAPRIETLPGFFLCSHDLAHYVLPSNSRF
jgi:hypothetical protein